MDFYYYYCLVSDSLIFCNRSVPFPWTVSMKNLHIQLRWWLKPMWKRDDMEKVEMSLVQAVLLHGFPGQPVPPHRATGLHVFSIAVKSTAAVSLCFRGNSVKYWFSWWFPATGRRCFPLKHPKLVLAPCSTVSSRRAHFLEGEVEQDDGKTRGNKTILGK